MGIDQEDCFHLGAKALIRTPERKFLLLGKEHRTRGFHWDIPGGRLQRGESLVEALQRELEEETGLKNVEGALPFTMVLTHVRIPIQGNDVGLIMAIYCCEIQSAFTPKLSCEHTSFGWFSTTETILLLKDHYPLDFIEKFKEEFLLSQM